MDTSRTMNRSRPGKASRPSLPVDPEGGDRGVVVPALTPSVGPSLSLALAHDRVDTLGSSRLATGAATPVASCPPTRTHKMPTGCSSGPAAGAPTFVF